MPAECAFQLRCSRHHEVQVGALLREFSLDVQKVRTGNMPRRERVETGYGDVRDITPRWLVIETRRTIENAKVGLVQDLRKLFGTCEFTTHRSLNGYRSSE
jgi:hypothetical protein